MQFWENVFITHNQQCTVFSPWSSKAATGGVAKFTEKHLCRNLLINKVARLRSATLSKKRLSHRCFPVNFVKFLRTLPFMEHLWWLFLDLFWSFFDFFCLLSSTYVFILSMIFTILNYLLYDIYFVQETEYYIYIYIRYHIYYIER